MTESVEEIFNRIIKRNEEYNKAITADYEEIANTTGCGYCREIANTERQAIGWFIGDRTDVAKKYLGTQETLRIMDQYASGNKQLMDQAYSKAMEMLSEKVAPPPGQSGAVHSVPGVSPGLSFMDMFPLGILPERMANRPRFNKLMSRPFLRP